MKRSFIREILESIDENTISFAGGLPDESLFPIKDLNKAAKKVFKHRKNFQYNQSSGIYELRNIIAKSYQEDGFETKVENILITSGSQQALYIIAKYFQSRDILLENPSYLGAVSVFEKNSLKMQEISNFTQQYKQTKLAYLIPDFQNPKGTRYSIKKRNKIAKTLKKYDGYIIEDSPYNELYFDKKSPSISSLIPDNSLHLGSFSKTLSPSFRIGWIRTNSEMISKLCVIKESIDLHSCGISQYILAEYLKDNSMYQKHLNNLRNKYKEKMRFFSKTLKTAIPNIEFKEPNGGMFIYAKLRGVNTRKLLQKAQKKYLVFVPGREFYIAGKKDDEIRFNFSNSSKDEIQKGINILKSLL